MEIVQALLSLFLHLDKHMAEVIQHYGFWTYLLLFLIVFCETGLVVTPFLPGDSLLFAAGTFAAAGALDVGLVFLLLFVAAISGDNMNYWIGRYAGPRIFSRENVRLLNKRYLEYTQQFYQRHGKKTIIMARFVPIVRTFCPFVAGIGRMDYKVYLSYDVFGGLLWVGVCVFSGYFFGGLAVVKEHFSLAVLGVIFVSVLPAGIEFVRHRKKAAGQRAEEMPSRASLPQTEMELREEVVEPGA